MVKRIGVKKSIEIEVQFTVGSCPHLEDRVINLEILVNPPIAIKVHFIIRKPDGMFGRQAPPETSPYHVVRRIAIQVILPIHGCAEVRS